MITSHYFLKAQEFMIQLNGWIGWRLIEESASYIAKGILAKCIYPTEHTAILSILRHFLPN